MGVRGSSSAHLDILHIAASREKGRDSASATDPGGVWHARSRHRFSIPSGAAGTTLKNTAHYAGENCDPLHLAEIEHCRPYFLGFLGERYGWVPEQIPEELLEAQPWLDEHRKQSVTALEILHADLALGGAQDCAREFGIRRPARTFWRILPLLFIDKCCVPGRIAEFCVAISRHVNIYCSIVLLDYV